jgi:integrase
MSVLFNHARRYDLYDRNPIQWVRQSAKRRCAPDVLTSNEVRQLLAALEPRERIMVLLDVATGLRQSELFALKCKDVDFNKQLWVTRSIGLEPAASAVTGQPVVNPSRDLEGTLWPAYRTRIGPRLADLKQGE